MEHRPLRSFVNKYLRSHMSLRRASYRSLRYPVNGMPIRPFNNARFRQSLARAARTASARSRTNTTAGRRNTTSGIGVSVQHDVRRIYRKKTMPRKKKRIWKKFVKKVHAVAEKDMGSRTILFNAQVTNNNNVAGSQGCLTLALYSMQSTNAWLSDLNGISALENVGNPTAAAGVTLDQSTKFLFQSGVLDLTIRNTSFVSGGALDPAATLELDIYECTASKDFQQTGSSWGSLSTAFAEGSNNTKVIGGAGSNITIQTRGATPFDIPYALSRYGIKVWKKTKYFISNGSTVTYQMRDPARHVIDLRTMSQEGGCNLPKMTKFCYLVYKCVPGVTIGAANTTESIQVGVTRKYMYKIEGVNEDRAWSQQVVAAGINPN